MFRGMSDREKRKIIIVFLYLGVAILVYLFLRYMLYLAAPFLMALFFAWALNGPVTWLNRKIRFPRAVGGVLVLMLLTVLIGSGFIYVGSFVVQEIKVLMSNYGLYAENINNETLILCSRIDAGLGLREGSSYEFVDGTVSSTLADGFKNIVTLVLNHSVGFTKGCIMAFASIFISVTATIFLVHDFDKIKRSFREGNWSGGLNICFGKMFRFGLVFIRTQLVIMAITTTVCSIGLILLGNPYAVLIGIGIGLLDALPVFGTGTVLIPWTIILLFFENFTSAAVIFSIYLICYSVREILEPKLMGSNMGIHPVIMLLTMYAGVILFGVAGFILGPAAYIMVMEIMEYVKRVL